MVHGSVTEPNKKYSEYRGGLLSLSFLGLLLTQFLSIVNDNLIKWLVAKVAVYHVGEAWQGWALGGGSAAFVLPFILFASPAGFLADRFSKGRVIVSVKAIELLVAVLAVLSILTQNIPSMFLTLFLLGTQASLFGPAKLGSIPELVTTEKLSIANGIANLATVVAIIIGTISGFELYVLSGKKEGMGSLELPGLGTTNGLVLSGAVMLGLALLGLLASLAVRPVPSANPHRVLHWNILASTRRDLKLISRDSFLLWIALGQAFFWSLACLAQLNLVPYAEQELKLSEVHTGYLMGGMALGVCFGSVIVGIWSGKKVELRIVPFAAAGLVLCGCMLYFSRNSNLATAIWLFLLGAFGGAYDVPLMAYLQKYSREEERGSVFAANNFLTFAGMFVVSILFWYLTDRLKVSPPAIFLLAGLITIPVGIGMLRLTAVKPSA